MIQTTNTYRLGFLLRLIFTGRIPEGKPALLLYRRSPANRNDMNYKEANTGEIAELILCGHVCYIHTRTGILDYHPMEMDYFTDEENPWQEVIDKVGGNRKDYIRIEPMDSTGSFAVMEAFARQLESEEFGNQLLTALSRPKPFRNFNYLIHGSEFRQAWFDFRQYRNIEWVKEQIADREHG